MLVNQKIWQMRAFFFICQTLPFLPLQTAHGSHLHYLPLWLGSTNWPRLAPEPRQAHPNVPSRALKGRNERVSSSDLELKMRGWQALDSQFQCIGGCLSGREEDKRGGPWWSLCSSHCSTFLGFYCLMPFSYNPKVPEINIVSVRGSRVISTARILQKQDGCPQD